MTREEAVHELQNCKWLIQQDGQEYLDERDIPLLDMAIEALSNNTTEKENDVIEKENDVIEVVRCKECRHAHECHKSVQYTRVQYTRNEPTTITMGYAPIEFCSHGERREP